MFDVGIPVVPCREAALPRIAALRRLADVEGRRLVGRRPAARAALLSLRDEALSGNPPAFSATPGACALCARVRQGVLPSPRTALRDKVGLAECTQLRRRS